MFDLFRRLQWLQRKFHLSHAFPLIALVSYTAVGAAIFRALELERDHSEREFFRTTYDDVLNHVCIFCFFQLSKILSNVKFPQKRIVFRPNLVCHQFHLLSPNHSRSWSSKPGLLYVRGAGPSLAPGQVLFKVSAPFII